MASQNPPPDMWYHVRPRSLLERLQDKIAVADGCWEWLAARSTTGYGVVTIESRQFVAHRVVYELLVGPIPEGLELDHLCRNRGCVRPDHLEAVTQKVNILRSDSMGAVNARKTHCVHGHEFTAENTYLTRRGQRYCRECDRRRSSEYKQRKKGA